MSLSPLLIVAIVVGLLIVVVVVILLAGGAAWFMLRKKPKTPANRQASPAVQSRPRVGAQVSAQVSAPVRTPSRSPASHSAVEPHKPAIPQPARPVNPPAAKPEALKRAPQALTEIVDNEQERVAQEMSGKTRSWQALLADAFNSGAQESAGSAGEIPASQNISPDAQILADTLNNTAKDVGSGIGGLAEADMLTLRPRLPGLEKAVPFLDLYADTTRQLALLVQDDSLAARPDAVAFAWFTLAAPAPRPRLAVSLKDSLSGGQVLSGIVDEQPPPPGARVSLSQAVQQVTWARQTVEKAYLEVLSSLGNGTRTAGSTPARGFDKAKEMLSGGSQ